MQTDEAEAYIPKLPPVMIRKPENIHTLLKALSETYGEAIKMRLNREQHQVLPSRSRHSTKAEFISSKQQNRLFHSYAKEPSKLS
ncbi:hypothetical protein CDAR_419371 [Caerostris darwini]|uniref:Uncharacterized protein n=1 Tax=Caerostris darwini TaxID=1538125 RepID=A0AAV4T256_9ARAC|nr:hypothetical protein CDAR_565971 [Caerostris darwini]GIY39637.1 hypothetical protein CDAR_419371 [Caerostris darwini]